MLELEGVSSGYGERSVLEGISASLEKGAVTAIIGANGSGKSTLLKTLLGLLPTTSGEVRVDGESIAEMKRVDVAKKLAYLAQGKNVPDMTVGQMVLHGRFPYLGYPRRYTDGDRALALECMRRMGIAELADAPLGELSGGMRQNAYVAMALAQQTDYILLDEPTTYLDVSHQLELMKLVRGLADDGKGVVCVMHDLPLAFEFSDDILLLDKGRVLLRGSADEINGSPELERVFGVRLCRTEKGSYYYDYRRI